MIEETTKTGRIVLQQKGKKVRLEIVGGGEIEMMWYEASDLASKLKKIHWEAKPDEIDERAEDLKGTAYGRP